MIWYTLIYGQPGRIHEYIHSLILHILTHKWSKHPFPFPVLLPGCHNYYLLSLVSSLMSQQDNQEQELHAQSAQTRESGSIPSSTSSSQNEGSRFTFVLDQGQAGTRSHAMRAHWAERHRINRERRHQQANRGPPPIIAARETSSPQISPQQQQESMNPSSVSVGVPGQVEHQGASISPSEIEQSEMLGVPGQILNGVNHALSSTRLDPFDTFPIKLTVEHHKLIHHCTV